MAEFQHENIAGRFLQGMQQGQQMRAVNEQRQDRLTLRDLAAGAIGGDPNALSQAYAIDPNAGQAYAQAGELQGKKMRGAAMHVQRAIDSGDPAAIERAYQDVRPFLLKINPQAPPNFTPDMRAKIGEIIATTGYFDSQSDLPAEVRTALFFQKHPELIEQERERYKNRPFYDSNTGQLIYPKQPGGAAPMQAAPPSAAPPNDFTLDDDALRALLNVPASDRPAALQAILRGGVYQAIDGKAVPGESPGLRAPPMSAVPGPSVVQVGPSAGQRAYDSATGKGRGEYDSDRARAEFDARQAGAVKDSEAYAGERGKVRAEVENKNDTRGRDADRSVELLTRAIEILPEATGGAIPAGKDRVLAAGGKSTAGARANAQLKLYATELAAKVPRFEGPQSNIDVQFYKDAAGDLGNENLPVETRLAAAREMLALKQKYATAPARRAAPATNKTWVRGPDGKLTLKGS